MWGVCGLVALVCLRSKLNKQSKHVSRILESAWEKFDLHNTVKAYVWITNHRCGICLPTHTHMHTYTRTYAAPPFWFVSKFSTSSVRERVCVYAFETIVTASSVDQLLINSCLEQNIFFVFAFNVLYEPVFQDSVITQSHPSTRAQTCSFSVRAPGLVRHGSFSHVKLPFRPRTRGQLTFSRVFKL